MQPEDPPKSSESPPVTPVMHIPQDQMTEIPTSPYQTPPKKGVSKILVTIVLIAATLFIAAYAGVYITLNRQLDKITHVAQPSPSVAVKKPTPTSDQTANWKTYTNIKFGFSFRYPPSLVFIKESEPDSRTEASGWKTLTNISIEDAKYQNKQSPSEYGAEVIQFVVAESTTNKTFNLENLLFDGPINGFLSDSLRDKKIDNISVDGVSGLLLSASNLGIADGPGINVVFTKNTTVYQMESLTYYDLSSKIIKPMLSTFKFLDASISPTCIPRPACLDATPRCLIAESPNMCPKALTPTASQQTACTDEAKLCPDGKTSVGRTGPNCEFAACPK